MLPTFITSILCAAAPSHVAPIDITHFVGDNSGVSASIARFIMYIVNWILGIFHLENEVNVVTFLYAAVVLALAIVAGYIVQRIVLGVLHLVTRRWKSDTFTQLSEAHFFHRLCNIIIPLVFLMLIAFTLSNHNTLSMVLTRASLVYMVIVVAMAISAFIKGTWQHINTSANKKKLPLSGLAQLAKGIVWIVAIIVSVAIILDKSPASLLAGLTAFAAVLMLVFKDSILGVVAGVQLSQNNSLHVGDWISVGGTNANGTVTDVSLTAVKILNWDKTTTTVPPYNLISNGFTNYRTMQTSNTRRICRSYMIDADSIQPATPQMLESLRKLPFMDAYITKKLEQRAAGKVADVNNPDGLVNGTIDTNLGLFRAYLKMWIDANANVSHVDDCFISTLPQTSAGIPLQVYCFTNTSAWFAYEAIQDSIFEHVASMLSFFGLYTFENPSGRDTVVDGYLSPGKSMDKVLGIPYPFFTGPEITSGQPSASAKAASREGPAQA